MQVSSPEAGGVPAGVLPEIAVSGSPVHKSKKAGVDAPAFFIVDVCKQLMRRNGFPHASGDALRTG